MLERVYKVRIKQAGVVLVLLSVSVMLIVSGLFMSRGQALSVDAARDCDSNAVIYCGALTTSELQDKYNHNLSVRRLYKHFGITRADIDAIGSTAVEGVVYQSGNVKVNSKTIATDAMTAGRQDTLGSTPITIHKTTFYERHPDVSFVHNRLKAFVVMDANGQFRYAIIASCGNPVIATPVMPKAQSAPQAQQIPPTTSSTPTYIVNSSSSTAVSSPTITVQVNQQNAQVGASAPVKTKAKPVVRQKAAQVTPQASQTSQQTVSSAPAQAEQPAQQQAPQQLVNTGPGPAFTFAGLATMGGTVGRLLFIRRKVLG